MKFRLFWKILAILWLTIAVVTAGVWLTVSILNHGGPDIGQIIARMDTERARSASVALHYGGQKGLDQVLTTWPDTERARLVVTPAPNGESRFSMAPRKHNPALAFLPLAVQLVFSLVFSAVLAAYLSRPVGRLRDGFQRLAQGALDTRLTPDMGGRRDEVADLARDFDIMAERLQILVAARDRLLHDVSHELRSPLARLNLAVTLARRNGELGDQAFARIEAESRRLDVIVGDLLSLARAESKAPVEDSYFDVADFLGVICDDARFEAQPLQVGVDLTLSPDLVGSDAPLMIGAPELLRRAIENVIRNALRFSPPGGTVDVSARLEAGAVAIDVGDRGPGAAEDLIATMFDPFVKGAGETRGVGLGLAIAQRALAARKGQLQAFNRDGGGLLVRMVVPVS